jgi:hypothetical protein
MEKAGTHKHTTKDIVKYDNPNSSLNLTGNIVTAGFLNSGD